MSTHKQQREAEHALRAVLSTSPAVRASWSRADYEAAMVAQSPGLRGWLSHRNGSAHFWRMQDVIDDSKLPDARTAAARAAAQPYLDDVAASRELSRTADICRNEWCAELRENVLAMVPIELLRLDMSYQRADVKQARVSDMVEHYDPARLGTLTVGRRKDGSLYVVDGQHRFIGMQQRGQHRELPCSIFDSKGAEHEAQVFAGINLGRSNVSASDKFRALVEGREAVAVALNDTLNTLGWRVSGSFGQVPGHLRAIAKVYALAKRDLARCNVVLSLVDTLCKDRRIETEIIDALAFLDSRIENGVENKVLVSRLKRMGVHKIMDVLRKALAARSGTAQLGVALLGAVNVSLSAHSRIIMLEI